MSQAEKLLNSLNATASLANTSEEPHIVIGDDRVITVPDQLKRLAVQYDHDIETVTFDCPRYWDGLDMSGMTVYVNYLRSDSYRASYKVSNVTVDATDDSTIHFNWTISRNVSLVAGKLTFLVCIRKTDDNGNEVNHWNSELCKDCYVSEGLESDAEELKETYPDIVEQWHNELITMADAGDFNGLSPTIEVTDITGGHKVIITDVNGTKSFDVLDAIIDKTEAVTKMLNDFVYIGYTEPTTGPILWLDTTPDSSKG